MILLLISKNNLIETNDATVSENIWRTADRVLKLIILLIIVLFGYFYLRRNLASFILYKKSVWFISGFICKYFFLTGQFLFLFWHNILS